MKVLYIFKYINLEIDTLVLWDYIKYGGVKV